MGSDERGRVRRLLIALGQLMVSNLLVAFSAPFQQFNAGCRSQNSFPKVTLSGLIRQIDIGQKDVLNAPF